MSFIQKQRDHAEAKKLGRTERYCDYDGQTFKEGERAADAATKPRLQTAMMYPVGRKRGVCKPGSEDGA